MPDRLGFDNHKAKDAINSDTTRRSCEPPMGMHHMQSRACARNGGEGGYILILCLVLLMSVALTIPAAAKFATAARRATDIKIEKVDRFYAADSGIKYALHQLHTDSDWAGGASATYQLDGCAVDVAVSEVYGDVENATHVIRADSTDGSGRLTSVEATVSIAVFSYLFENAITSAGDVYIKKGTPGEASPANVTGDVQLPEGAHLEGEDQITGEVIREEPRPFPAEEQLAAYYWKDVRDVEPYPDELLQLDEPQDIGPLYRDGHLRMKGKGQAQLHGTLYVTGDLRIDSDFGVALNGHTIYAGGEIEFKPGSRLSSPGCIIAAGDIYFSPKMENDAFVLVLSLGGKVTAKPNNTLYGSLAGYESVELESNAVLEWTPPPDTLNFPGFTLLDDALGIITYSIIRL